MKITYVTMQFPVPSETFSSQDVEALRRKGYEITVYGLRTAHKEHNTLISERAHEGLVIENYSFKVFLLSLLFIFQHPLMFFILLNWVILNSFKKPKHFIKSIVLLPSTFGHFYKIYQEKPNVVHLFWGHYPSMVGFLVKRFMPKTVVSQFLGAHDLVTNYPGSYLLAQNVDLVFTHSNSNLSVLKQRGVDLSKVHVVFRGTNLQTSCVAGTDKFDEIEAPIFLTAARLIETKGVDDVLSIFSEIIKLYPHSHLNIAGDGPHKSQLVKIATDLGCSHNISFLGHVGQSELIEIMSETHFFILMSRYPSERLPNVVKEAMFQKCIVLTSDTEGIEELIDSGVSGFIVKKRDCLTSIDLILTCLRSSMISKEVALEACSVITERFDVNKSMQKYIELWEQSFKERKL